ncbi:MAG: hypothetical protein ACE5F9_09100 [Phycisphaerae bacterium]
MRPSTRRWLFAALAGGIAALASSRLAPLNAQRESLHLAAAPLPQSAEPSMMLKPMLALGRAPLVDYLWMRATRLKEQGRYFDANQLSRLICDLQPRFAAVWAFQAWNMAYNISVTLNTPEERWRWVRNGIELLRDKGLPLNPNSTQLYRELAWIFFHKVGDFSDEMHFYYKLQLALMVEDILGEPPDDFVQPGRPRGRFYRSYDYAALADAPKHFEDLDQKKQIATLREKLRENPADRETAAELARRRALTQSIKSLVDKLRAFGFDAEENGVYLGLLDGIKTGNFQIPNATPVTEANLRHELETLMGDPDTADARQTLENFWRAHRLKAELKIDPATLVKLNERLGLTVDLRLAEAHALYWTYMGLEKGADRRVRIDIQRLNTTRIGFFCLQHMFYRGRLAMSTAARLGEPPLLSPDLRVGEVLFQAYLHQAGLIVDQKTGKGPVDKDIFAGFVGFVRLLVLRYGERGLREKAEEKFEFLRSNYPDPLYDKGLDAFLALQYRSDRTNDDFRTANNRIIALLDRGIIRFAFGEDDEAARYMNRARQVYDRYQKNIVSDRNKLEPFRKILEQRVHFGGGRMYRDSYELVCRRLGFKPLPLKNAAPKQKP